MTRIRAIITTASLLLVGSLAACGSEKVFYTCDEPQPYQAIVEGKRVTSPDGLDPLDDLKEMSIPKAETPPRPEGSVCIESPPSILIGEQDEQS